VGYLAADPGIRLTQAVKHRTGRRLVEVQVRATLGEQLDLASAVPLARLNGTLRDRLNCLSRKPHAFAKDVDTWDALLRLALCAHNGIRPHVALRLPLAEPVKGRRYQRRTPAMARGLSDHLWSWREFLRLPVQHRELRSLPGILAAGSW
jgi:hypothetical protein